MKLREVLRNLGRDLKDTSDSPFLESELFLSAHLGIKKEDIYFMENIEVQEDVILQAKEFAKKRNNGYPFFYIYGKREFFGINFKVCQGVFIPRPETEVLVEYALDCIKGKEVQILDIGVGSGCILLSFLHESKGSRGVGIDISQLACNTTIENAKNLGLSERVEVFVSDLRGFTTLSKFDLVVSNPPYVKRKNLLSLKFEPREALDGGEDGFDLYPALVKRSFELLHPDGIAIFEIDSDMGERALRLMELNGFKDVEVIRDLANMNRFIKGVRS